MELYVMREDRFVLAELVVGCDGAGSDPRELVEMMKGAQN